MKFDNTLYDLSVTQLRNMTCFRVTGADRVSFLQGQLTNDLNNLNNFESHLNSRLNRTGRVIAFCILANMDDHLLMITPNECATTLKEDLDKFIIMDDVEINECELDINVVIGPAAHTYETKEVSFSGMYLGEQAKFILSSEGSFSSLRKLSKEEVQSLEVISGWPVWNLNVSDKILLNNTILEELGISYKKGCFLGQETVSKVHHGRGPASYPTLLEINVTNEFEADFETPVLIGDKKVGKLLSKTKIEDKTYLQVQLNREFRISDKEFDLSINDQSYNAVVRYYPFFKSTPEDRALELYHKGVDIFHDEGEEAAIKILSKAIELDPTLSDAYETLGVIYGRLEQYEKAIEIMDQLLKVNESSVMAHTNKSLFFMKMGKIEEAEDEKSQATIKSFAQFGEEAKAKRAAEELKAQEEAELKQREGMFLQVLEIDEEDTIANFGMGDIYFKRNNYEDAIKHLERVILADDKYSMAYLILGKSLELKGETQRAKEIFEKGITVASKQGNMMPANEMQARLSKLS